MKHRIFSRLRVCILLLVALALGVSCARSPDAPPTDESTAPPEPTGPAGVALREDGAWKLYSPEGRTVLTVAVRDGELRYSLSRDGKVFLEEGALGLTVDGVSYGTVLRADGLGDAVSELRTDVRRVLAVADDLSELVNNTMLYQLCEPADEELFADGWVKPGRTVWSWITGRTADGSEPNADSPVYGEPLSLGVGGMLRLYAEPDGQIFRLDRYISASRLTETQPDLQLTDADWLSAATGYPGDPATKDRNTKNNPITIDGTVYSRGLGTNAVGSFTYAVPDGAKRFAAVCGIDDNAKVDANYVIASSQILVTFGGTGLDPGQVYYRTRTFVYGEKVLLELSVPAGAETITITCGDAGDGNTCDNVSLGNPGWMLS